MLIFFLNYRGATKSCTHNEMRAKRLRCKAPPTAGTGCRQPRMGLSKTGVPEKLPVFLGLVVAGQRSRLTFAASFH